MKYMMIKAKFLPFRKQWLEQGLGITEYTLEDKIRVKFLWRALISCCKIL